MRNMRNAPQITSRPRPVSVRLCESTLIDKGLRERLLDQSFGVAAVLGMKPMPHHVWKHELNVIRQNSSFINNQRLSLRSSKQGD